MRLRSRLIPPPYECPLISTLFVERDDNLLSIELLLQLCGKSVRYIYMYIFLGSLFCSMIYVSAFMPIQYCFDYDNFVL